jgi:hypothetical protein
VKALGRVFNCQTSATTAAVRCNLRNAGGITIVAIGATSGNVTVTEANAATGGTSQNLPVITTYYTSNNGVWTKVTQAAAATFTLATGGLAIAEIDAQMLDAGFSYVAASHASASFVYLLHSLTVARKPESLVGASL